MSSVHANSLAKKTMQTEQTHQHAHTHAHKALIGQIYLFQMWALFNTGIKLIRHGLCNRVCVGGGGWGGCKRERESVCVCVFKGVPVLPVPWQSQLATQEGWGVGVGGAGCGGVLELVMQISLSTKAAPQGCRWITLIRFKPSVWKCWCEALSASSWADTRALKRQQRQDKRVYQW